MGDGWCPFVVQQRGEESGPFGYPAGARGQNRPVMFVDHRPGGYKRTLDDSVWRHANWVGVHFGHGRDGSATQYASIFDASWGNGVAGSIQKYDRTNARLALIEAQANWRTVQYAGTTAYALIDPSGANALNIRSISSEHEDENKDQPWTPAMVASSIAVKLWCLAELAAAEMPMEVGNDMLVGHYQIDAVNRAGCPGDNWPRAMILDALVKGGRMLSDTDIRSALVKLAEQIGEQVAQHNGKQDAHAQKFVIETMTMLATGKTADAERNLRFLYRLAGKAFPG